MTTKEKAARIKKLNRQIAELEAKLTGLREELAKLELAPGDIAPLTGLDMLWDAALPKSRERSSRHLCRVEWNRIPAGQRPKVQAAVDALKAWNKCEQWTKDANAYAKGLHLFIKNRMWEDVPQMRDPIAKYRAPKTAAPAPQPEELATAEDVADILGSLTRKISTTDQP